MIELMLWGSCVCAIISILVALRCIYIEHHIRTYADNDFKALNDTKIKFSDTTKLFGFPEMGYSEMKAEDMMERIVKIITRYGKQSSQISSFR